MLDWSFMLATSTSHLITVVSARLLGLNLVKVLLKSLIHLSIHPYICKSDGVTMRRQPYPHTVDPGPHPSHNAFAFLPTHIDLQLVCWTRASDQISWRRKRSPQLSVLKRDYHITRHRKEMYIMAMTTSRPRDTLFQTKVCWRKIPRYKPSSAVASRYLTPLWLLSWL